MEKTFIMIKPDAVRRKLVGEIISRIERRGLDITAIKRLTPSRELAERHYAVHKDKYFFSDLVDFVISGPVVAMVVEGENAVKVMRHTIGATDPDEALPGTIRGDFALTRRQNVIHGADSPESAEYEIGVWFEEYA